MIAPGQRAHGGVPEPLTLYLFIRAGEAYYHPTRGYKCLTDSFLKNKKTICKALMLLEPARMGEDEVLPEHLHFVSCLPCPLGCGI